MTTNNSLYTPWRFSIVIERPIQGSRWYYGNFVLGLTLDSHPRFFHVGLGLVFFDLYLRWDRDADPGKVQQALHQG
jgi:hypothetical protein